MRMDADLLAIGPFSRGLEHLEYNRDFYADVPEGASIIVTVGHCCSSRASEELARALHIGSWDLGKHCHLDGKDADLAAMAECFECGQDDVDRFLSLRARGFKFYYMPNG